MAGSLPGYGNECQYWSNLPPIDTAPLSSQVPVRAAPNRLAALPAQSHKELTNSALYSLLLLKKKQRLNNSTGEISDET